MTKLGDWIDITSAEADYKAEPERRDFSPLENHVGFAAITSHA